MSNETISIYRQFPVIDGFVQLPDNLPGRGHTIAVLDFLDANPGATLSRMSNGVGPEGGKNGAQQFVSMPGILPSEKYEVPATS